MYNTFALLKSAFDSLHADMKYKDGDITLLTESWLSVYYVISTELSCDCYFETTRKNGTSASGSLWKVIPHVLKLMWTSLYLN